MSVKSEREYDDFDEMTKYLTVEARWHALDSLACVFHNQGYSLQGNTEHNDTLWLARMIWARERHNVKPESFFDHESAEVQQRYMLIAETALNALPAIAERIASRYVNISKAIRAMERISREQAQKMREKKRRNR